MTDNRNLPAIKTETKGNVNRSHRDHVAEGKGALSLRICGRKKRTLPIKVGLWMRLKGLHVDSRTRTGRWMNFLRTELIRHVGGEPTVAEAILIEQIVIKTLKVHFYHVGLFQGKNFGSKDHVLAIQNSIRLDLQCLGLQAKACKVQTLEEYLRSKEKEDVSRDTDNA